LLTYSPKEWRMCVNFGRLASCTSLQPLLKYEPKVAVIPEIYDNHNLRHNSGRGDGI
jgi:hypothetical protein